MIKHPETSTDGEIYESESENDADLLARFCNGLQYFYYDILTDLKKLDLINQKNQQISQLLARRLSKLKD